MKKESELEQTKQELIAQKAVLLTLTVTIEDMIASLDRRIGIVNEKIEDEQTHWDVLNNIPEGNPTDNDVPPEWILTLMHEGRLPETKPVFMDTSAKAYDFKSKIIVNTNLDLEGDI